MKRNIIIIAIIVIITILVSYVVGKFAFGLIDVQKYSLIPPSSKKFEVETNVKDESLLERKGQAFTIMTGTVQSGYSETASFGLKIIKNATIDIYVDKGKFLETYNTIASLVSPIGGSVINSYYSKDNDIYSGFIEILIPKDKFDFTINKLGELGNILNLKISSTDVTQEYVDLNSRLKVLDAQKELLTSWLKQAKTIDDLLRIRSEIENVESEIEQIKGRLNYIALNTDFSKIDIYLKEGTAPKTITTSIFDKIKDYLKVPLNAFLYSVIGLLVIIAFLIPWVLLGFGIYYLFKKIKISKV
ncbi:DUF4349 domain-containing protein [Caldisericum exile]|uniref:DUF4349 domain-containing protein n=1 Tax=Caldisericum exile (strain DSM 21853 / NBRC 104410 / AZM16c01) TaxID=511051 RepID=A0A7U6GDV0_CALEA|nr:DUF4349 domain-containing protein [Caldisericum exile]BAL80593.1 hypothetical protein CSE_04670 [Caldisericum exile AZM16c01]